MFNELLNKEQLKVLSLIAIKLAEVDGKISDEEKDVVKKISKKIGETYSNVLKEASNYSLKELCEKIKDDKAKIIILMELISLCYEDGDYSEEEKKAMDEIRKNFKIDKKLQEKIEKWVEKSIKLLQEGFDLIFYKNKKY